MQKILTVWSGLSTRRQIIVVAGTLAMLVALAAMSRIATNPTMKLLYGGLEVGAAGDVVRALDQQGAVYEIRGDSIYVPANRRDELRMTLAGEGLPATGGRGYELLDSLSGFGTTSQMFDVAYWRAKEGELARTILASPHISQARVHIANANSGPFQRSLEPTASVSLIPAGSPISPAQANAIRFLVASAVSGMNAKNVAVIDANGTLIGAISDETPSNAADDRAKQLRDRVLRLVEARVGAGNAVVEVSVDTVTETESIRQKRIDPEERVAISTDTEERTDSSKNRAAGNVTVASNLPDGDAAGGDGSQMQASETRERVNYEVSETEHEILRVPGAVKRLTVAVLVNGLESTESNTNAGFQPRPDEELTALHDLVASAVGFDADRGDVITLRSMDLPAAPVLGTSGSESMLAALGPDLMSIIQIMVLAIVTLILGLFVVRPIMTRQIAIAGKPQNASLPSPRLVPEAPVLTGEIDDDNQELGTQSLTASQQQIGTGMAPRDHDRHTPVDRLRAMIGERQEETVEILRGWLEEHGENA